MMKIEGYEDEDRKKKNIMVNGMIIKYKGRKQEECHHDDRYDD
jgi:hypothetical protein